ncbi:glutamine--fructose-6-phosphate transaminase (isomerizing) [Oceanicaulis alexandrii]|uniref:glutamine--fructose-6-phosphate transaminase (isomerizing) n=1 Tax=Oceanicaulis alexandrii TaxID=153233 RepID=UPI0003B6EFCC|nr:glutamine--fructose-6-phosphate transaminase (isomerizing) [Oceanicaulis alexandrii]
MCGIVATSGNPSADRFLIEGLYRLEYRGYDSAGIALINADGTVRRTRACGKVSALEEALDTQGRFASGVGIAHTRWATHGPASEKNAHPHTAGRVTVVHNGIIENDRELRHTLSNEGADFASDTDSEVIAHLLDRHITAGYSPEDALNETLEQLRGAFAFAAIIEGEPDLIIAARKGAPLLVATGDAGVYLASDPLAVIGYAASASYLVDGDRVIVRGRIVTVRSAEGVTVDRDPAPLPASASQVEKSGHAHFMAKEIHEQPVSLARTLTAYLHASARTVRTDICFEVGSAGRLAIVACGTAGYAGAVARYGFESLADLPSDVDTASEFRYRSPALTASTAALFISQSGETADTLEALRLVRARELPTMALINAPHSTMAREADLVLPTHAGPEIGVASTKAFTSQVAALFCLQILAARQRGTLTEEAEAEAVDDLMSAPATVSAVCEREAEIAAMAPLLSAAPLVVFLGRREGYPLALEGALKLKEISYIHAEGFPAGELKHGPLALIEPGVMCVILIPSDDLFDKTRASIEQVRARGSGVIAITDQQGAQSLKDQCEAVFTLPSATPRALLLAQACVLQLLAYHVARLRGADIDQPRNLAKSVTVE